MNPEQQQLIEQIKILAEKLGAMEGGSDALMKALKAEDSPEEKEKREKAEKAAIVAKSEKEKEEKDASDKKFKEEVDKAAKALIAKALETSGTKGPVAQDDPKKHFEANLPEATLGAISEIKKSVLDLCDIVKKERERTDGVEKAFNALLAGLGMDKVFKAEDAVKEGDKIVHKTLKNGDGEPISQDDIAKLKKSLEAQGFNLTSSAKLPDEAMAGVEKSQLSNEAMSVMFTGRSLRPAA